MKNKNYIQELTLRDIRPICGYSSNNLTGQIYTKCTHHDNKKGYCNSSCPILDSLMLSKNKHKKEIDRISSFYGGMEIGDFFDDVCLAYTASGDKVKYYHQCKGKVYLSGAVTNKDNYKEDFDKAEQKFKQMDFEVFNPTTVKADSYQDYLRQDLSELLKCDFIYYVNDISSSKGAFVEKMVAEAVGIDEFMFWD